MHYIKLPHLDFPVSVFAVCQAHQQLEVDYNVGGLLRERFANRRRNASTGVQLHRMGYSGRFAHVNILSDRNDDVDDDAVRDIYLLNVLKMGLPMDSDMRALVSERFTAEFLAQFPAWRNQTQVQ